MTHAIQTDPDKHRLNRGYTIALASDHAGLDMRVWIRDQLRHTGARGHDVIDLGPMPVEGKVDYPDYARKLVEHVRSGEADRGMLICGSGIGMSMAANRFVGIRCALVHDVTSARLSRMHNNANVLALGARLTGSDLAWEIVQEWLRTPYEGGRHDARIAKLDCM